MGGEHVSIKPVAKDLQLRPALLVLLLRNTSTHVPVGLSDLMISHMIKGLSPSKLCNWACVGIPAKGVSIVTTELVECVVIVVAHGPKCTLYSSALLLPLQKVECYPREVLLDWFAFCRCRRTFIPSISEAKFGPLYA